MLSLTVLALRRTLPLWLVAAALVLLVLAARAAPGMFVDGAMADPSFGAPLLAFDERQAAGLRALARQNVWSVLFVLAPLLFLEAARLGTGAARAWLAPTPAPASSLALALVLGAALACAAATGLTACIGEAASDAARPGWRRVAELDSPRSALFEDAPGVRWSTRAPVAGERLRLWLTLAPGGGPSASARLSARAGGETRTVEARLSGRCALDLELPVASGAALELELERSGPGAPLLLGSRALELLAPVASERRAALALGARAWLALASGCALALGLGSVLRPALAAGVVLALGLGAWARPGAAAWIPGADLPRVWDELASGLVPGPPPVTALCGALLLAALGAGLYARALRSAEGAP